jgi:hypothetical protein
MDKQKAFERLREERDYEDELVKRLNEYILGRIENIPELSNAERDKIRESMETIIHDSLRHAYLFSDLMQTVIEDDERQY